MTEVFDTVLLLALPASGKSEVRRYLEHQDAATCADHFHMGPTVQLDDYPYVHMMRVVDDAMAKLGEERIFFTAADGSFRNPLDWGTLIALINEDYDDIRKLSERNPEDPTGWFFSRIDAARRVVDAPAVFESITEDTKKSLTREIAVEVDALISDWNAAVPESIEGKTIVIEFARGGPDGSSMPLPPGFGYGYSLARLSPDLLARSAILYIWVTPEQSRAKNRERAKPGADGSILFHGVPEHVMYNDYGCDDMEYLVETSAVEGALQIEAGGVKYNIPAGRFDNRDDLTTFIREDPEKWAEADIARLREGISRALDTAWGAYSKRFGN